MKSFSLPARMGFILLPEIVLGFLPGQTFHHPEPGQVRGGVTSFAVFLKIKRGETFEKPHVEKRTFIYLP
jgi:hypothetical protein